MFKHETYKIIVPESTFQQGLQFSNIETALIQMCIFDSRLRYPCVDQKEIE